MASEVLADELEATRKYQMWKANTSALLEDALKYDEEREPGMSRKLQENVKKLCLQLAPLTKSNLETISPQMFKIIEEALDLDQLFSKQIAQVFWTTADSKGRDFDEELMELHPGERRTADSQKVQLVVAPGLVKNGRSTGEDYGRTNVLLRIAVSCEAH